MPWKEREGLCATGAGRCLSVANPDGGPSPPEVVPVGPGTRASPESSPESSMWMSLLSEW